MSKSFFLLIVAAAAASLVVPLGAAAMGISPNEVNLANIHRDYPAMRDVFISRMDASTQVTVLAEWSGNGVKYIEPEAVSPFIMQAGQKSYRYKFKIGKVGAEVGEYDATLKVKFDSNSYGEQSFMSVSEGAAAKVHFSITDKAIGSDHVSYFSLRADGDSRTLVEYTIDNTGNFAISYGKIVLINAQDGAVIEQRDISKNIVRQFSHGEFREGFQLKKKFQEGDVFRAEIYNSRDELVLNSNKLTPVAIGGGVKAAGKTKFYWLKVLVSGALVVLVCLGVTVAILERKKKTKKQARHHSRSNALKPKRRRK